MFITETQSIVIFLVISSILILFLASFVAFVIYRYQQKQNIYFQNLEELKVEHENLLLRSKLEMQEQTFANISREIHDNIGQKLTLVKLHLNTLDLLDIKRIPFQINDSVTMIGEAIGDLSDISRSLSSEMILNNGFIKALEFEVNQFNKLGLYRLKLQITGEPVFLEANTELILFRITQEALNNIVKHAEASDISIGLHYEVAKLTLDITDNGRGFECEIKKEGSGLTNMMRRAKMLDGICDIFSKNGSGTTIKIEIPVYERKQNI